MMNSRIGLFEWAMLVAQATAKRSTCFRRGVGCVLLDSNGRILATGVNGVAMKEPHCNEYIIKSDYTQHYPHKCNGGDASSGVKLDECLAIHAEQNALLQCPRPDEITYCVTTTSPCMTCVKLLLNTPCKTIVFIDRYPDADRVERLWRGSMVNGDRRVWRNYAQLTAI